MNLALINPSILEGEQIEALHILYNKESDSGRKLLELLFGFKFFNNGSSNN